MTDKNITR